MSEKEFVERVQGRFLPLDDPADLPRDRRVAAVLVLLYPHDGEIHLVLTRKPETLRSHAGQISLPGGARDPDDATLLMTALRETWEEIGVPANDIEPLGRLPSVAVRVSGFVVVPYVGWTRTRPFFEPNATEVASLLDLPLRVILDPAGPIEEVWEFRGGRWRVYVYRHGESAIWGATARILGYLAHALDPRHPAPSPASEVLPVAGSVEAADWHDDSTESAP